MQRPQPGLYRDPGYTFERVSHCASVSQNGTGGEQTLYLALLNKDANRAVTVHLDVPGIVASEAEIREVGAASYLTENSIARPNAVKLTEPRKQRIADDSSRMSYRLMPNTLVSLRLPVSELKQTNR